MNKEKINDLAKSAMLEFTESEITELAKSLDEVMEIIDRVNQVNLTDVEKTLQVNDLKSPTRPDVVTEGLNQKEATKNAELTKYGYFEVVKFVE